MEKLFTIRLTLDEMHFIQATLPSGLSLHKVLDDKQDSKSQMSTQDIPIKSQKCGRKRKMAVIMQENFPPENTQNQGFQPQEQHFTHFPQQNKQTEESMQISLFEKISNHKNAWLFQNPVNEVKVEVSMESGSTESEKIGKNMGLWIIEKKIKNEEYQSNFEELEHDIGEMIKSKYIRYRGDKNMTSKIKSFEKFTHKIFNETRQNLHIFIHKNCESSSKIDKFEHRMTLLQKKQLEKSIKTLKPQNLQAIKQIIFGPQYQMIKHFQLDFDAISPNKIIDIQNYVKLKLLEHGEQRGNKRGRKCPKQIEFVERRLQQVNSSQEESSMAITSEEDSPNQE